MSAPLRIGLYAPNMARGTPSGVERSVRGLIDGLAALGGPEEYVLLSDAPAPASPNWRRVEVPGMGRIARLAYDHGRLAEAAAAERLDVLHCPKSAVPRGLSMPALLTIHDLIFLKSPADYGFWWRLYWNRAIRKSAARSRVLLCPSDAVRADVDRLLPEGAGRVRVVPWGVDPAPFGAGAAKDLGRPYFLCVGTLTRRKNLELLLEAHAKAESGAILVVAGSEGLDGAPIAAKLRAAAGKGVILAESPADGELGALYRGALALLQPSRDEGFGLPLLEAMSSGCPVIASTAGALPEVAGDAALLAPPDDAAAWADAMRRAARDPALRADLAARGRKRVEAYSWRRTAELTRAAYREAAGRPA